MRFRITEADLDIIRDRYTRSGYRHVQVLEEHRDYDSAGRQRWKQGVIGYQARVLSISLGNYPHPREAAKAVVDWLMYNLGPDWAQKYRAGVKCPFAIEKAPGGWLAVVWVNGERKELVKTHAERRAARAELRAWLKDNPDAILFRGLRSPSFMHTEQLCR